MNQNVILLASLDTKAPEAEFLRDCIVELGDSCIVLDIGYGRPADAEADITAAAVARAAGTDIDSVRSMHDTGAASNLMMQGATIKVHELLHDGRLDGVVAFGGASNTTLATGVMKTLPVGIPKLMISSSAAMPAYAARYYGSKDLTIMHAIVDISGMITGSEDISLFSAVPNSVSEVKASLSSYLARVKAGEVDVVGWAGERCPEELRPLAWG